MSEFWSKACYDAVAVPLQVLRSAAPLRPRVRDGSTFQARLDMNYACSAVTVGRRARYCYFCHATC